MPYVRISLMKPVPGHEDEVRQLNQELVSFYRGQQGCQLCYFLAAADSSGEVGRVSVWDSEHAADQAANHDHSMALRSRLHLLIQPGHQDRSFIVQ